MEKPSLTTQGWPEPCPSLSWYKFRVHMHALTLGLRWLGSAQGTREGL